MISLRSIFGKDDRFFRLLTTSASEAQRSLHSLSQVLQGVQESPGRQQVADSRRRGKGIHEEISEHVIRSFVTSLEREDIESLSSALHRIVKHADKIAERFELCRKDLADVDFRDYAEALDAAGNHVYEVVKDLRRSRNIDHVEVHANRLLEIERKADQCQLRLVGEIHRRHTNLGKLLVLRDLCRFLERIMDRCVEVGEVLTQIVMKNT